jgi:hypothetical protein
MLGGVDCVLFDVPDNLLPVLSMGIRLRFFFIIACFFNLHRIIQYFLSFNQWVLDKLRSIWDFDCFVHLDYILMVDLEKHLIWCAVLSGLQEVITRLYYLILNSPQLVFSLAICSLDLGSFSYFIELCGS